ncbi:MAG: glycerol-3-phosphate dehydrogenase/oxidase [Planctomycetota bacterium]|jgi:glycerol-3-phosphate dehydrogenase
MGIGSSTPLRDTNLARLAEGVHDVLVVGGGINGAVSAAALSGRGASVALIDRSDFASFTSQESSNLVWGGIKYLENYELALVYKLCRSRNELMRSYPANIREIRFFAPIEKRPQGFKRTLPVLHMGVWFYWLMGGCFTRRPRRLTVSRIRREEPNVNAGIMRGGIEYSDAFLFDNDARFVFGFVRTALRQGAAAANYVEARGSTRNADGVWETAAFDRVADREITIRSRVLLNAAGPYVDGLNEKNDIRTGARHVFSKGIHIVVERLASRDHVLTFFDDTNRMFFVIPMGHRSAIGTTDTRVDRPESEVTDEDRTFLLEHINHRLKLSNPLTEDDIIAERCGVRPLVVEGEAETDQAEWVSLSRKHVIAVDDEKRHISIYGGKLTDCLNIGEEIAAEVGRLGVELPHREARWYGEPPEERHREFIEKAAAIRLDDRPDDPEYETLSERLWRRYGEDAFPMLDAIAKDPGMADPVSPHAEYRRCEVEFAAQNEMVVTLEDILRRRSKLSLVMRRQDLQQSEGVRDGCGVLFGDDAQARIDEYFAGH